MAGKSRDLGEPPHDTEWQFHRVAEQEREACWRYELARERRRPLKGHDKTKPWLELDLKERKSLSENAPPPRDSKTPSVLGFVEFEKSKPGSLQAAAAVLAAYGIELITQPSHRILRKSWHVLVSPATRPG